jgi:hypothetical protein
MLTHWSPAIDMAASGCIDFHTVWKTYIFTHPFILVSGTLVHKIVLGHMLALPESANIIGQLHLAPHPTFPCSAG